MSENTLTELKRLLEGISGDQKDIKEKLEAQEAKQAELEEKMGKTREDLLTELENKGVGTVRAPNPLDITEPNAADAQPAKRVHLGYDLDVQGGELALKAGYLPIKQHTMLADTAKRDAYSKFLINCIKASQGDPKAQASLADAKAKAAMQEGTTTEGGYLVPDEYTNEILAFARLSSVALQYCRLWNMSTDVRRIPAENAAVSVAWTAEEGTITESEPTVAEVVLTAKRLDAYSKVSNELLQDSAVDIVSWLTELFAEAMGQELDNQVFAGTGDPISGLTTAACGYSVVLSSGNTNISAVTGTNLSDMISKLSANKRAGARWYFEKSVFHFVRTLKDSNNAFLYNPIGGAQANTIWGYPYTDCEKMPSTNSANSPFALFGNLRYFALGRRLQSTTLDVDPYGLFTTYQTRFRIVQRWGLAIGLANGFVRAVTAAS